MSKHALILYRGPLERARLSYIIETIFQVFDKVSIAWIFPGNLSKERLEFSQSYLRQYHFESVDIIQDTLVNFMRTRRRIGSIVNATQPSFIAQVGFSMLAFGTGRSTSPRAWFINGIPEERNMGRAGMVAAFANWLQWKGQLVFQKPTFIITVSERMKRMVMERISNVSIFVAPTCVDIATFRANKPSEKRFFTYLGSGAPWQALDMLSAVWKCIHRADPEIRFRVISRDARCRVLAEGIAPDKIEFQQSNNFGEVAEYLNEGRVGFLLRRDNIVNRVSFPTKFAEYLASGCWVVATDLDWDINDYMRKYEVGVLVGPDQSPNEIAERILHYAGSADHDHTSRDVTSCAEELDRQRWIDLLKAEIRRYIR